MAERHMRGHRPAGHRSGLMACGGRCPVRRPGESKDPVEIPARAQRLGDAEAEFASVPFDGEAEGLESGVTGVAAWEFVSPVELRSDRHHRPRRSSQDVAKTTAKAMPPASAGPRIS